MNKTKFQMVKRSDYQPPVFLVDAVHLTFSLDENKTKVVAQSKVRINPAYSEPQGSITLFGEHLRLDDVHIDGVKVDEKRIVITDQDLTIQDIPDQFDLQITTTINPAQNSSLSGLYLSSSIFCTQCEAEGFRRITYYLDRPDVLASFTTRVEADRSKYPILLSNGNLVEKGELENGYHYAEWHDPFPKPSYLFALVAGNLISETDTFTTQSGREIDLFIYTEPRNKNTCGHALVSLKKSMRWDEEVYGLEYDLDRYMIVAVDDFNMGAMENKGLNIFNSKYVLASPETATDQDYLNIEGVIAHEYFHNWTGNRVTCRDWFQLSLKEGLTVFRDQEFSADMNSRAVQRIKDVRILRQYQFREDEGPMAHPVRPDSYMEINNFYTVTVYNKGAEVVRMIHTLIGPENFRKGMDLYFDRHDGQAVTCDDFVAAMADSSNCDLSQFQRWYSQAGTPLLTFSDKWLEDVGEYQLTLRQLTRETPGQKEKLPFHIPVLIGLLDRQGNDVVESLTTTYEKRDDSLLLELTEDVQTFIFENFKQKPIVSLLRSFSAPVKIEPFHDAGDTAFLMAHDRDLFNSWDASFSLAKSQILDLVEQIDTGGNPQTDPTFIEAFGKVLASPVADKSLSSLALQLPEESYLGQSLEIVDPLHLHQAHSLVKQDLAKELKQDFLHHYQENKSSSAYMISAEEIGKRSLKNCCLDYLLTISKSEAQVLKLAVDQYYHANNMTDQVAVLLAISHQMIDERDALFSHFEKKWIENPLVMDKWFAMQALSAADDTFERVQSLLEHQSFSLKNPNKVRALIGAFSQNHFQFHHESGRGYEFLAEIILQLDRINPQIAARLTSPLISWKRYEPIRKEKMKSVLKQIQTTPKLSRDVFEIASKGLES